MSRLTDLLRQVRGTDVQLGADLEKEIAALKKKRSFGLVFERHKPEAVEVPNQPVRRGVKVRVLPPRGEVKKGDQRLWRVESLGSDEFGTQTAQLIEMTREDPERATATVEDLVVVAEFEDKIYPGLIETGRVERGGDKPFHTVINAENFHALEMLTYTHRGKVDAIYIDPPYNTGARDWKYNNDYVEGDDDYRHSKWLAFMERRLRVAHELLNADDSVLIVAIDENEYPRLVMLMKQLFPEARLTTVSVSINPKSTPENGFGRVDEYLIFAAFGAASPERVFDPMLGPEPSADDIRVRWRGLTRTGANGVRSKSPGAYYPIFINSETGFIVGAGEVPADDDDGAGVIAPPGTIAVWPTPRPSGTLGRWSVVRETFDSLLEIGAIKTGRVNFEKGEFPIWYLTDPMLERVSRGEIKVSGRDAQGAMVVEWSEAGNKKAAPRTLWHRASHSASEHGTGLLAKFLPSVSFDFAKSLYAVEDSLRLFLAEKKDALVLDFFSGSGTTAHAVMRLNRQDGGNRQCISITNNEVSADEQGKLRRQGYRPGDYEWEQLGICDFITKPRIRSAITGLTPGGEPIKGDYKFSDEFPMAEGLEENAAFFTMTYETPLSVRHHRAFNRIGPMLWMRAGATGRVIDNIDGIGWDVSDVYAVLANLDDAARFFEQLKLASSVRTVFVVTDDDAAFQMVCRELPIDQNVVRLYESYLQNFELNQGRSL